MKKKDIVKSQQEFNKIITSGNKIANKGFVIYYKVNHINHSRYGISVGKKLGNAVFRNKYKRKIRMIIHNNINLLKEKNTDYILMLRKSGINLSHQQLEEKFIELAKDLKEI